MTNFEQWYSSAFGVQLPSEFSRFLSDHPKGMENGFGPRLWTASVIQAETEDRALANKGVCIIGACDSISHILLRARDGKVFIVDSRDHQEVDAWFADIDVLIGLLQLE